MARGDFLISQRDRFEARGTRLVYRVSRHFLRDAAADGDLASGIRASASLACVAEDRLFNLIGTNGGAVDGGFSRNDSHVDRGHGGQGASELTDRRACG